LFLDDQSDKNGILCLIWSEIFDLQSPLFPVIDYWYYWASLYWEPPLVDLFS